MGAENRASMENKKAAVVQHPKAFDHVGLLFSSPRADPGGFVWSSDECRL
jgi:hypothetical protein